jgi:hypothetical protein
MSIKLAKNPYRGINPHLNSALQTPGSDENGPSAWHTFHVSNIALIADYLNETLPPDYVARLEPSLQPKVADALSVEDVMLTLDPEEDFISAVVIHRAGDDPWFGPVVTRIELLSPTNKPGSTGYLAYRRGRNEALRSGVSLVELDYLHETPPPLRKVPVYPHEPHSHAYRIFINDPRPSIAHGRVMAYGFDVDGAFPLIYIPLAGEETLPFDFGKVYQHTFERGCWGIYGDVVDYERYPVRFETYSAADQKRVTARMAQVAQEAGGSGK